MNRTAFVFAAALSAVAAADTLSYDHPSWDRWNYPFNGTPGTRDVANTFGSGLVPGAFDDRDGQFLNTFVTDAPTGLGVSSYHITSARFTVSLDPRFGDALAYDPSYDSYHTELDPSQAGYTPDTDAGRPIELYGTGFRNGFDAFSYSDNGPFAFGDPTGEGVRNAYAADVAADGTLRDVSNNIRDGFEANPFAVGQVDGLAAGDLLPGYATFIFDLDVSDAGIQHYLATGLDAGALSFSVTSLHPASVGGGGDITYPGFFTNENLFPDGMPATLELSYEIVPAPGAVAVLGLAGLATFRRRR